MSERFFVPDLATTRIDGVEAHHLLHVLRAVEGDRIVLFDGSGQEAAATIVARSRSDVTLDIEEVRRIDRELPFFVRVAMPLPKGDRLRFLVEKLTELGVASLTPAVTARSVSSAEGKGKAEKAGSKAEYADKLVRWSIDACKQCGRNRLLQIDPPVALARLLEESTAAARWIADPSGESAGNLSSTLTGAEAPQRIDVLVGPEGGFTPQEIDAAVERGWTAVSLGNRVLRMETAAIALAAVLATAPNATRRSI